MDRPKQGYKLAATCCILIGMLYLGLIIYAVIIPSGQRYDMGQFFENYARDPAAMNIAWILMAATSVLVLAVVPAVGGLVHSVSPEWTRAASILGLVGSATSAVSFLTMLGRAPELARAYVAGDSIARAAIVAAGLPQLDPLNLLVLGGVGLWYLIVNVLALRGGKLPRMHALLGTGLAVFLWLAMLAAIVHSELLDQVAAGAGALLAPSWYVWLGVRLARRPAE